MYRPVMSENFAIVAIPLCGTRVAKRLAHDRVDAANCVVVGIRRFEIAAEGEFMMERGREPVVVERFRPRHHHLSPNLFGTADIDGVWVEALGAMLKTIDLPIFDPHEVQVTADKKSDIAIPKARGQQEFRIAVEPVANDVDRQNKLRRGFSIHALPPRHLAGRCLTGRFETTAFSSRTLIQSGIYTRWALFARARTGLGERVERANSARLSERRLGGASDLSFSPERAWAVRRRRQPLPYQGGAIALAGFEAPDLARVFAHRAIAGETAHPRDIEDSLARPVRGLEILARNPALRRHVRCEVRNHKVIVAIQKSLRDPLERTRLAGTEAIGSQRVKHPPERRVAFVILPRVVGTGRAHLRDSVGGQAENENVLVPDFFAQFYIGAVERSDRQRAVHRELHVAGSRSLGPSG